MVDGIVLLLTVCIFLNQQIAEGYLQESADVHSERHRRDVDAPITIITIGNCDPSNIKILNGKEADVVASASEDIPNEIQRNGVTSGGTRSLYEIIRTVLHSAKNSVSTTTRDLRKLRLGRKLFPSRLAQNQVK